MTGGVTLHAAAAWRTEVTGHEVWNVVEGLDASLVRFVGAAPRSTRTQNGSTLGGVPIDANVFTAALDGKTGRDQQQSNGGEVTDINAVRRSERDQDFPFWEGFNDHEPDGHGGQREGLEPAAAALGRSRHLQMVTTRR